jgi:hypothetical protein
MKRFFFNIVTAAGKILDPEGTELGNLDIARTEAIKDARMLMSDALMEGKDISSRSMEITDETGEVLLMLPFVSAFNRAG